MGEKEKTTRYHNVYLEYFLEDVWSAFYNLSNTFGILE